MTLSAEILVHVSAPSRGSDDARYRKEAHQLLDFEPAKIHELLPRQTKDDNVRDRFEHLLKPGRTNVCDRTPVQRPGGQWRDLPSSLIERLEQATPYGEVPSFVDRDTFAGSLLPPPFTSKVNAAVTSPAITSTTRVHVQRTPALPRRPVTPTSVSDPGTASSPYHAKSISWRTPPSVIPDSQPPRSTNSGLDTSSSSYLKRAIQSDISSSPIKMHENRNKKRRQSQLRSPGTSGDLQFADSDNPIACRSCGRITPGTEHLHPHERSPLEIHPPRPRPSTAQFHTHLTPPLRTICKTLPLADLFKPFTQARSLDKLERGHWYIQCQTWDEVRKTKFWQFLAVFISEGKAGWGVWCCKEFEEDGFSTGSSKENKEPLPANEVVKVYCWGEVVREIWLLLWLASANRTAGTGARWVDAQGKTVFNMA